MQPESHNFNNWGFKELQRLSGLGAKFTELITIVCCLGGLFEYVSGANFFGEIIEWSGFALACCTIESAVFAISTLLILSTRAQHHHQ